MLNLQTKSRTAYLLCFPAIYHLRVHHGAVTHHPSSPTSLPKFTSNMIPTLYLYDCGDLNARISNIPDFDKDLDTIPPRLNIDNVHVIYVF